MDNAYLSKNHHEEVLEKILKSKWENQTKFQLEVISEWISEIKIVNSESIIQVLCAQFVNWCPKSQEPKETKKVNSLEHVYSMKSLQPGAKSD